MIVKGLCILGPQADLAVSLELSWPVPHSHKNNPPKQNCHPFLPWINFSKSDPRLESADILVFKVLF